MVGVNESPMSLIAKVMRSSWYPVVLAYVRGGITCNGPCPCLRKYVRVHFAHGGHLAVEAVNQYEAQKGPN